MVEMCGVWNPEKTNKKQKESTHIGRSGGKSDIRVHEECVRTQRMCGTLPTRGADAALKCRVKDERSGGKGETQTSIKNLSK